MDLPAIMVSNMLAQDGHLLSSQLPTVSLCFLAWLLLVTAGKEQRVLQCQCCDVKLLLCKAGVPFLAHKGVSRIWEWRGGKLSLRCPLFWGSAYNTLGLVLLFVNSIISFIFNTFIEIQFTFKVYNSVAFVYLESRHRL